MDLCDTPLQVDGHLVHLTLNFNMQPHTARDLLFAVALLDIGTLVANSCVVKLILGLCSILRYESEV